jgi:predicted SPOUT superfamily RNA methylase MTH1
MVGSNFGALKLVGSVSLEIGLVLPASFVSDAPNLRQKTLKVGRIGRLAAIFRVGEVLLYADSSYGEQRGDLVLIKRILEYMETPQYLRKRLHPSSPLLRFAGILPPLASPHHPLKSRKSELRDGEFREGVVVKSDSKGSLVDIGVERPQRLRGVNLRVNTRITVRVGVKDKKLYLERAVPGEVGDYWGYVVRISKDSLGSTLKKLRPTLVVLTSRYGSPFSSVAERILDGWRGVGRLFLVFGGPYEGLREILGREKTDPFDVGDFVVNFIPDQATRTVRTEEAVSAALAILNIYRRNASK